MDNLADIRLQLSGTTGMESENEEDLFRRIKEIEENDGVVTPLQKTDWWLVVFFIVIAGIAPVIWYAIKLF